MFTPGNIIYAEFTITNPPKKKYLVSLYRSETLNIIACFTTSQQRSSVSVEYQKHGKITNAYGEVVSYIFMPNVEIGVDLQTGARFSFPKKTTIPFDYCFQEKDQFAFSQIMKNPKVVCKLCDEEYLNLLYAMYQSVDTPEAYKPIFESILSKSS